MSDPRARQTMVNFVLCLNGIQTIGEAGFANLLDTATPAQMTELARASEVLLEHLKRCGAFEPPPTEPV